MIENNFKLGQEFTGETGKICPKCSSPRVFDPITWFEKLKYAFLVVFIAMPRSWVERFQPWRKCDDCGFEYKIKTKASFIYIVLAILLWISFIAVMVLLAKRGVQGTPPPGG